MTGPVMTKLRFVRCPKCRKVLPELANVPLYQCGGCGTLLQAKKRESSTVEAEPRVSEPDIGPDENLPRDTEAQNFSQEETLPSSGHLLTETNSEMIEIDRCHSRNSRDTGSSSTGSSMELVHHGTNESNPDVEKDGCFSRRINGSFSHGEDYSIECNHHELEVSSVGNGVHKEENDEKNHREFPEFTSPENKEVSSIVEMNTALNKEFRSPISGSSTEHHLDEGASVDNLLSPRSEELEQSPGIALCGFERMSSIDTLENIVCHREMTESPASRSFYGCYGTGSSCDETDDQVPDRKLHISRRKFEERSNSNSSVWQDQNGNCSASTPEKKQFSVHGPPVEGKKIDMYEHRHRALFYPPDYRDGYSNGSNTNDEGNANFYVPKKREHLEEEKMKLLRMVHDLEAQLSQTYISERRFSRVAEKQVPAYYDESTNNQEFERYNQGRLSQIPFSPERTMSGNQVSRSRLCSSSQLCGKYTESNPRPLHSYDAKSKDSSLTSHSEVIKIRTQRHYLGKKQVLPIAGGPPFLQCYSCLELLQMPADFLLFKRRCHQLKCGSCSAILKFSLYNGTHIVKYIDPEPIVPHVDASSFDDSGPSFCKSVSTEGEPSSIDPQCHDLRRNSREKILSSNGKKGALSKLNNLVRGFGSAGSSSRRSKTETSTSNSEIEEVPTSTNSPLHRLMGYSSVGRIIGYPSPEGLDC